MLMSDLIDDVYLIVGVILGLIINEIIRGEDDE